MSGVDHSAAFEAVTAVLAGRRGTLSEGEVVEALSLIVDDIQTSADVFRIVLMLSQFNTALLARLSIERGEEPEDILREIAIEWAISEDDANDEGDL